MSRTAALALLCLGVVAVGLGAGLLWPSAEPALACAPAMLHWTDAGIAFCSRGPSADHVPAGPALTLGVKLDLNRATEQELALVPGVGPALAGAIVAGRGDGGYRSWDQLDLVPGIGPVKLEALQLASEIR